MMEQVVDATDRLEEYLDLFVHIRTADLSITHKYQTPWSRRP